MIFRKISLAIVLIFSVCFLYAQGYSLVHVEIENQTQHEYHVSVEICQSQSNPEAFATNPSYDFIVPGYTTVSKDYEYTATDICLCDIWCEYPNEIPIGYFNTDCGNGYPAPDVEVAPQHEDQNHIFIFDDYGRLRLYRGN